MMNQRGPQVLRQKIGVEPGKFAIVALWPRLNEAGNSVRSLHAIRDITGELGVGVFWPNPA